MAQQGMMVLVVGFQELIHPLFFYDSTTQQLRFPFLPLLLISIANALQLLVCWKMSYDLMMTAQLNSDSKIKKKRDSPRS